MDNLVNFLNKIPAMLQKLSIPLAIIMMICSAILMMTGQRGGEKAKIWIAYILIAIALVFLAAGLVTSVQGQLG